MSEDFQPSPEWLKDRWDRLVRDQIFATATPSEHPVLVLLGAQPGAGETAGARRAEQFHAKERFVAITGDDYRRFHPDHRRLLEHDPVRMPDVTQSVSGPMVNKALSRALAERFSITLEGTFRDPLMVVQTADRFAHADYQVHAVVLAVPPVQSLISTLDRHVTAEEPGHAARWTPVTAHDAALRGLPITVEALGNRPSVGQVTVIRRPGQPSADFRGESGPGRARAATEAVASEQRRQLTSDETHDWLHLYDRLRDQFDTAPTLRDLVRDPAVKATWEQLDEAREWVLAQAE